MRRSVTLRIKRKWLEAIASGDKRVEYRVASDFNSRLLERPFDTLVLHYQTTRRLEISVERCELVELDESVRFYAIYLGEVISERS